MKTTEIAAEWVSAGDWVDTPYGFQLVRGVEYADEGVLLSFSLNDGPLTFWYDELVQVAS
jgi:hypothetical protein